MWPRVQLASPLTQSLGTVLLVLTLTVHPVLRARKSANNATQLSDRYSSLILVLTAHNLVLQLKLNVFDAFRQVALSAVTGTVRRSVGMGSSSLLSINAMIGILPTEMVVLISVCSNLDLSALVRMLSPDICEVVSTLKVVKSSISDDFYLFIYFSHSINLNSK